MVGNWDKAALFCALFEDSADKDVLAVWTNVYMS